MGDYSGIASFNNRVYGAWAEDTAPKNAPPAEQKKPSAATAKDHSKDHTIVRVGVADFSSTSPSK